MNIIVVGCGRVGAELAYRLYQTRAQGDSRRPGGRCL